MQPELSTMDRCEGETFLAVPFVDQMEVLGTVIHCSGNSFVPADHRLMKADKATWKFHNLLFCHDAPLLEMFGELVKRIFPIVCHGCGSWGWSQELCDKLSAWESNILTTTDRKPMSLNNFLPLIMRPAQNFHLFLTL